MAAPVSMYLTAVGAMLFAAASALTLIAFVNSLDKNDKREEPPATRGKAA